MNTTNNCIWCCNGCTRDNVHMTLIKNKVEKRIYKYIMSVIYNNSDIEVPCFICNTKLFLDYYVIGYNEIYNKDSDGDYYHRVIKNYIFHFDIYKTNEIYGHILNYIKEMYNNDMVLFMDIGSSEPELIYIIKKYIDLTSTINFIPQLL